MSGIELKMAMLSGAVLGLFFVVAEGVALHSKVARYLAHLHGLRRDRRLVRLYTEISGIAFVVLIQPVIVSVLVSMTLGHFNPQFSNNAMMQLKQGLHTGN
jgi:hypothetical protein